MKNTYPYIKLIVLIFSFLGSIPRSAESSTQIDQTPTPKSFLKGVTLETPAEKSALFDLELPPAFFENVKRPDWGDVRVFNAENLAVPHEISEPQELAPEKGQPRTVPFFPIRADSDSALDDIDLEVNTSPSGHIVNLKTKNTAPGKTPQAVAYILDTTSLETPVDGMILHWSDTEPDFVRSVRFESSDDLEHWALITSGATVASLEEGGNRLVRDRVDFGPLKAKYWRLSWLNPDKTLTLKSIEAVPAPESPDRNLAWKEITATRDEKGDYLFDTGGYFPVEKIEVNLPVNNTILSVALSSGNDSKAAFQTLYSGLVYRLTLEGSEIKNPPLETISFRDRYIRLSLNQKEGGLGSSLPTLKIGYYPRKLVFVAQGQAPFLLALGNPQVQPAAFQIESVMKKNEIARSRPAQWAVMTDLSSPEELLKKEPHRGVWILWGVLGGGVILLGLMAYRLLSKMDDAK